MNTAEAVARAGKITAEACAEVLGTLSGQDGRAGEITVVNEPEHPWEEFAFPLITVRIEFIEGITGANLFAIAPEQARMLAAAMMGLDEPMGEEGELSEIEISAVSEAMNQMMGSVATAMAEALETATDIATPDTRVLQSVDDIDQSFHSAAYSARFDLTAGGLTASIVQLVDSEFAERLQKFFTAGDTTREVLEDRRTAVAAINDDMFEAVDRTARITADSAAQVLSTLIGDDASATLPTIEPNPDDPLGKLKYPLVFVEVDYVSGVNGSNLFVLTSEQTATLAAVMMGSDEAMGDGLSDLELSAVSEAMNQMMGAATNILADTLRLDIEVAPPECMVVESAEAARAQYGDAAFCSRFRLVSERMTADVVQLVPADFAEHLRQAFAAADYGRAVVSEPAPAQAATALGGIGRENPADRPFVQGSISPELLRDVRVRVSAELGRARVPISRVVNMPPGAIVELDRAPSEPIDLLVNGRPFAAARLVLVDGEYAVQIVSLTPHVVAA